MKNLKGFSLIELLLVLSVIVFLSITSFYIYATVSENNKSNTLINEINIISNQLENIYSDPKISSGEQSIDNNGYKLLLDTTLPPFGSSCGKSCINYDYSKRITPYGGFLSITRGGSGNPTLYAPSVMLKGNNMESDSCVKLISYLVKKSIKNGGNIKAITVNGNSFSVGANTKKLPTKKDLINYCSDENKENDNISFSF